MFGFDCVEFEEPVRHPTGMSWKRLTRSPREVRDQDGSLEIEDKGGEPS